MSKRKRASATARLLDSDDRPQLTENDWKRFDAAVVKLPSAMKAHKRKHAVKKKTKRAAKEESAMPFDDALRIILSAPPQHRPTGKKK